MDYHSLKAWLLEHGTGDDAADADALRAPTEATAGNPLLQPDEFVARFTPSEFAAARASADPVVQQLMFRLSVRRDPLDLTSATVQQGLAYMAGINLLTSERAAAIGAVTPGASVAPCTLIGCGLMLDMDDHSAALAVAQARAYDVEYGGWR